jgi:hypothetical protein
MNGDSPTYVGSKATKKASAKKAPAKAAPPRKVPAAKSVATRVEQLEREVKLLRQMVKEMVSAQAVQAMLPQQQAVLKEQVDAEFDRQFEQLLAGTPPT